MFIDKSQLSQPVAHLWATEQPFRSYRSLEGDIGFPYYKHFVPLGLFPDRLLRTETFWTCHNNASSTFGSHADASITEEPGAGKLHAGICAGTVG